MINGKKGRAFNITRGVRQGDPLSCLLFDLAIEPLAAALRNSDLAGFNIPGVAERLIAALFADDTTTFLSENDRFEDLVSILDNWCLASRAKFNKGKTEALPVGSTSFRKRFTRERCLQANGPALPDDLRIAADGQSVRILGAWIGNKIDPATPWEPIVSTIKRNLARWEKRNPTMYGRKLILGLELGGRTQFLAKAQSMPPSVVKTLQNEARYFMWKGAAHPTINMDTLQLPVTEGGLNLLDLVARNEAIDLVWLRSYLDLSPTRPRWAHIADILIAGAVHSSYKHLDETSKVNTFLQEWEVSTRQSNRLPQDLLQMLKAAKKYRVRLDVTNPTEALKEALPVWSHVGTTRARVMSNSRTARCLRVAHKVSTVGACINLARRSTMTPTTGQAHVPSSRCVCGLCITDREVNGCPDPHKCVTAARELLHKLTPAWIPGNATHSDGLTLTKSRKRKNTLARSQNGKLTFDPTTSTATPLANAIRAFTSNEENITTIRRAPRPYDVPNEDVTVYTDGSFMDNAERGPRCGSGVWFGNSDDRNVSARVPGTKQSNQIAEIYAISLAVCAVPPFAALTIHSDSKMVVDGLTQHLPKWEDRGWMGVANAPLLQDAVARLRARSAPTFFQWVKGHSGVTGNEGADELAKFGAEAVAVDVCTLPPPNRAFLARGCKLSTLTQRLAYRAIKLWKTTTPRRQTRLISEQMEATLREEWNVDLKPGTVWKGIRHNDTRRSLRDFWWKALHGTLKIGKYWDNIPGYEQRASCTHCDVPETLEHIWTECDAPGPAEIWDGAHDLLRRANVEVPHLSFAALLATPVLTIKNSRGRPSTARTRLLRIILTESCHLIWKIRCERVIGREGDPNQYHSTPEIRRRWLHAINRRLAMDQALTSPALRRKAVPRTLVCDTWQGLLVDERALPNDWINHKGVLVGKPTFWDHG